MTQNLSGFSSVCLHFLNWFCRLLLYVSGWKRPSENVLQKFSGRQYLIYVGGHSSNFDFIITLIYICAYPRLRKQLYILVKPQLFRYAGSLFTAIGCIPTTRLENRGGNFVEHCSQQLLQKGSATVAISPKGQRNNAPWRSGYYHLARALNATICVGGIDYERKEICAGEYHTLPKLDTDLSEERQHAKAEAQLRKKLQKELAEIIPLHPSKAEYKLRDYNPVNVSVVDYCCFTIFLSMILPLIYTISWHISVTFFGTLAAFASLDYHRSLEKRHQILDTYLGFLALFYYAFILFVYDGCYIPGYEWYFSILALITFYYLGHGREKRPARTWSYVIYHSIFHLFITPYICWPLMYGEYTC